MIPFTKMHGLGNDFVVIDRRAAPVPLDSARICAITDRRRGIGCDQLVLIDPAEQDGAAAYLRFHNTDGSESGACGNGTRCVAAALMAETGAASIAVQTAGGVLSAETRANGLIAVDMGAARTGWRDIPLSGEADTLALPINEGPLADPVAVSMGNPHCVFFVDDAGAVDLAALGPKLEHNPWFPERTNVEVATVLTPDRIRLRVWERGAGITQACGTGACATVVAAHRRDLAGDHVTVTLDGGDLIIELRADGHVIMVGPVAVSFTGEIDP
jgi:diaminopimelate epimerase